MTLILAIPTAEGIVLASDTQVTSGEVRSTAQKIFPLNKRTAWAGAGEVALIQRVNEQIAAIPTHQPLQELRDHLAMIIKQNVQALLEMDVLTEYFQGDPNLLLSLHAGDFVFVEHFEGKSRMLHIAANGTPEWISDIFASGNGSNFAYALLQKYQNETLKLENAALLAYKIIDETIQVGAYGLGYPIDIWLVNGQGVHFMKPAQLELLYERTEELRQKEIRLLKNAKLDLKFEKKNIAETKSSPK